MRTAVLIHDVNGHIAEQPHDEEVKPVNSSTNADPLRGDLPRSCVLSRRSAVDRRARRAGATRARQHQH